VKAVPRHEEEKREVVPAPRLWNEDYPVVFPAQATTRGNLNLVIIGHVDAGKSTLTGHLLYQLGLIDDKTLHRLERDCKAIGKASFHFAWIMDADSEERERGVTMDVGWNQFSTATKDVTLLDAPGHADFVPKMISGTAQADAGILVVDSTDFERGMKTTQYGQGQTKEHAFLARSLGVTQLIVAVNKLDMLEWSQEKYLEIKETLGRYLVKIGFRPENLHYLPTSGLLGHNLTQRPTEPRLSWWDDKCLMEVIESLQVPAREVQKPTRMCVSDSYRLTTGTILGFTVAGKIEGGILKVGDRVRILPTDLKATVRSIELQNNSLEYAVSGQNVDVSLKDIEGEFNDVLPGHVLCSLQWPVPIVSRVTAKVATYDISLPVTKGQLLMLFLNSAKVPCTVTKLVALLDQSTGKAIKKHPRCIPRYSTAVLQLSFGSPICMERFSNYKALGRLTLRDGGATVMCGMVTDLLS
jgi:elongation factor 1 alpha-like protein